jgi:hypothetical protein
VTDFDSFPPPNKQTGPQPHEQFHMFKFDFNFPADDIDETVEQDEECPVATMPLNDDAEGSGGPDGDAQLVDLDELVCLLGFS